MITSDRSVHAGVSVFLFRAAIMVPLLLAAGLLAAQDVSPKERDLGRLYSVYSFDAYQEGNSAEAEKLLDVALVFDPANSDALAVSALLESEKGNLERALLLFEKSAALSDKTGSRLLDKDLLRRRMAETAFRLGYPERAYLYLQPLTERIDISVESGVLLAELMLFLGRRDEASVLAGELVSRYPESSRAVALFMNMETAYIPPFLIAPADSGQAVEKLNVYDAEVLRLLYLRLNNSDLRGRIGQLYRQKLGEDLFWYLTEGILPVADPEQLRSIIWRALELSPPSSRESLLFHRSLPGRINAVEAFDRWFENFSGTFESDLNGDGFIDTFEEYENGVLSAYRSDKDQNGEYDVEITFRNGMPEKVKQNDRVYTYSDYPYLAEMTISDGLRNVMYRLYPYSFVHRISFEPLLRRSLLNQDPVAEESAPSEERVAARSISVDTMLSESSETISMRRPFAGGFEYRINSGREGAVRERRSGEGLFVVRERDTDGDGFFEIRERYLDERLIELTFDEDGDGNYDYMESYGERDVFLWDLNDDGLYDCREFSDEDGNRIREVSTRLDGVFDYRSMSD